MLCACLPREAGTPSAGFEVAVTVDDLPIHGALPEGLTRLQLAERLIATLRAHHLPPVYGFLNGAAAQTGEGRAILEAWRAAGHHLGNHSYSHRNLDQTPLDEYLTDITRNEPLPISVGTRLCHRRGVHRCR